jgi:hypothetical protein
VTLDDDQRDWLRRSLEHAKLPATTTAVDRVAYLVVGSMDAYRAQQVDETMRRARYDALRDVWLRAKKADR